jgi:hypothetical protein
VGNLLVGPLVRAIRSDGVAIWTEWSQAAEITLTAAPADSVRGHEPGAIVVRSRTVRLGGRYYALSCLTGLQPATWYSYRVSASAQEWRRMGRSSCFRTLDRADAGNSLRLAHGSCRNLSTGEPDALSAFGSWLLRFKDEREGMWPLYWLLVPSVRKNGSLAVAHALDLISFLLKRGNSNGGRSKEHLFRSCQQRQRSSPVKQDSCLLVTCVGSVSGRSRGMGQFLQPVTSA